MRHNTLLSQASKLLTEEKYAEALTLFKQALVEIPVHIPRSPRKI